jgi:hypothetical protein
MEALLQMRALFLQAETEKAQLRERLRQQLNLRRVARRMAQYPRSRAERHLGAGVLPATEAA